MFQIDLPKEHKKEKNYFFFIKLNINYWIKEQFNHGTFVYFKIVFSMGVFIYSYYIQRVIESFKENAFKKSKFIYTYL